MKKGIVLFLLLLNCFPLLSGCWNQKELTDLAFVMAMGVDKGENKRFDVTFQIVNPGNVSLGQGGGGQGLPIAIYKSTGNTVTEAARNATKKVSRRLYYAHTNLLVISEELAKEDILNLLDALERDPEFRTTTEVVIAKGTSAEELVSTLTVLDKLPVSKITKEIQTSEAMLGENIRINIDDIVDGIISEGKQPIINGYQVMGDKTIARNREVLSTSKPLAYLQADGLGIIKDGKLIGWLRHDNARGVVWVLNKVKSTDISIDWGGKKDAINVTPIRTKTKVVAKIKNGKPEIYINIKEESIISEINTAVDLDKIQTIEQIDKKVASEIKQQVIRSIKAAQKQKSDVFGFGNTIHRKYPKVWKKLKNNWDEEFSELKFFVKVDCYQRRAGVRRDPFWSDLNRK